MPTVMFHHFRGDGHPAGQGAISADELRRMIEHLGRSRILPADQWLDRLQRGSLPEDACCLTFDDNLRCQYDVALPVLADLGLTAFWFVYTSVLDGAVERLEVYRYFRTVCFEDVEQFYTAFDERCGCSAWASEIAEALDGFQPRAYLAEFSFYTDGDRQFRYLRDQVLGPQRFFALMDAMVAEAGFDTRALRDRLWMDGPALRELHDAGHVLGLHSHTHPTALAAMPMDQQWAEYAANRAAIERLTGERPTTVSHPCNSYTDQTLTVLRDLGVRVGFRSNDAVPAASTLELPRVDHALVLRAMHERTAAA